MPALRYSIIYLLVLCCGSLQAQVQRFNIVDQRGNPISDAVLMNPQSASTEPGAEPAIMDQLDRAFVPMVLTVPVGQQVTFPNSDKVRHHVYSFSPAKAFEIKLYANTPKAPISFDNPGIVILGCNIHDDMIGYIVVSPWQHYATSNAKGQLDLDIGSSTTLMIWHPWLSNNKQPQEVTLKPRLNNSPVTLSLAINNPNKRPKFRRRSSDDDYDY